MAEKYWHFKRCDLFQHFDTETLSKLEARCRTRKLSAKSPVYLPVDDSNSVYLLAEGRAKICHITDEGKQPILAFIEPGELFGELALFQDGSREEYVETIEASTIVLIPGEAVQELMEANRQLAFGITKLIGVRRQRVERRLRQLLFLSNKERLTHLILDLVEQYGRETSDGVELQISLSHQDLANVIGSTRETVTVLLGKMQLDGLIRVRRRRVTVRKLQALAESADRLAPRYMRAESVTEPLPAWQTQWVPGT